MGLFGRSKGGNNRGAAEPVVRASRGWGETLEFLKQKDGLRVLDFGDTSPANINFLTSLGHSVYMANVVADAASAEWIAPDEDGKPTFQAEKFAATHFDFSGKEFDAVLLWDTADYLPAKAAPLLFSRLKDVLHPGGRLLAFTHGKATGPETQFSRFHISEKPEVTLQPSGDYPVLSTFQTRQMEQFLSGYADIRFLLGKDNIREVIAVR
ncbi:MAG: class I SAM-dependent methyltransferase [Acidobacteriaceae bacterium]|nr:class I SAM-dependent methyltransferase [Acidobacteriaceae bacterium]